MKDAVAEWLQTRNEDAAASLVAGLYPQVIACVRRHLPFRMDAEDLAQEVFMKLFANLPQYDARLPLENWVSRMALNVRRDHLRRRACRPELRWSDLSDGEQLAFEAALESAETPQAIAQEGRALLTKLLETLSADDRIVLSLFYLEERSIEETATLTGWSRVSVKVRAFRARARLRKTLAGLDTRRTNSPTS